jgi:hypothetical protein
MQPQASSSSQPSLSVSNAVLKGFPLLSAKLAEQQAPVQSSSAVGARPVRNHLEQYIDDIRSHSFDSSKTAIEFWQDQQKSKLCSVLPLIAQDYVAAPASQAYVERLFSVCGLLTAGRRNRMEKSLNMRAWLKVNHTELSSINN